ncbi:efflux RND transporter periplasmic adaptor subunit [Cupriavidus metallidurans]|uniref:HlyD family efflux transporter periplasmic adaptor subunit n=1 Tax=Cupriavidus metallidurans TaxID=119219 RepID=A0A482IZ74_9BURK|nr:efflux RND transporter periplasmic adaptor subunit [Cupriavidus metallidurans]QBP14288.1 HlyD family efflux transporter periplasmic adaptor subunit [Cupriavidus metallidurans]
MSFFSCYFARTAIAASALIVVVPVQARTLPLNSAQAQALGVKFTAAENADKLEVGASARVVLRPDAQYVVAAPYPGMVSQIQVAIGQNIKKGQPLASFASPQMFEASRAVTEARSQADLAQLALKRDKQLHDDGIIAGSRWEITQARSREAQAMLRAREAEMAAAGIAVGPKGEVRLVAGRDGVVADIQAVPGTRVDASTPLVKIVDPAAVELDLLVGRDQPAVKGGERVEVQNRGAVGKVEGVVPVSDGTGALRVRASLAQRGNLQAGENVSVTIQLAAAGGKQASRVKVPLSAITYVKGKAGIFVSAKDGVSYRSVTVDAMDDAFATVHGDIPNQARVATAGLGALKGMLVGAQ